LILAAILLLVAALAFVVAELFVPSHGMLAIIAGLCALGAVVLASYANVLLGAIFGIAVVIIAPIVFFWAARMYPHTPMGRRVLLAPPPPTDVDPDELPNGPIVGDRGITMTVLRPAGSVELRGQRVNCVSEAEVIPAGIPVEVIHVAGTRIVVKALTSADPLL
jgi:membrane-bound serine protease (ClpP class)